MSKKKLTLSVEERLSERAKAVAEKRGTSVSRLVETFFSALDDHLEAGEPAEPETDESKTGSVEACELSDWARQWRGAFREPGRSYPDDPGWEKRVLAEEVEVKHS